jgi:tellurite methyltransferase
MAQEPFWEQGYRSGHTDPFGSASPEVLDLLKILPKGAAVLDVGCGAGRNALPLARAGMAVTAIDSSHAACSMLRTAAALEALAIRVIEADLRLYDFHAPHDAAILHGVLHLLPRSDRVAVLAKVQAATTPGGLNVVAVFTDRLPVPPDLVDVSVGLFEEGELFDAYRHWNVLLNRAYTLNDEHPGGIRHEHPVNKVVARKRLDDSGATGVAQPTTLARRR